MTRGLFALLCVCAGLLAFCSTPASAAGSFWPSAPWQDLLTLDCGGTMRVFPSNPLVRGHFNASLVTSAAGFVASTLRKRAACHCPSASSADLDQSFTIDMGAALSSIEAKADTGAANRQKCGITHSVDQLGAHFAQFTLPSSCSSLAYKAGQPCNMQLPLTQFGMTLQMSIQQCPGVAALSGQLPSIQFSCSGKLCSSLLIPCSSNADCPSQACSLITNPSVTPEKISNQVAQLLDKLWVFPYGEQDSCATTTKAYTAATVGQQVFSALTAVIGNLLQSNSGNPTNANIQQFGFCSVAQFVPVELRPFWFELPFPLSFVERYVPEPFRRILDMSAEHFSTLMSFFSPLGSFIGTFFQAVGGQIYVYNLAPWDGTLDNGSNVADMSRRTGKAWAPLNPTSPIPSMAPAGNVAVNLASLSCNNTFNFLPNEPFTFGMVIPPVQELWSALMNVSNSLQTCRLSKSAASPGLPAAQFTTRFVPASLEFITNLFVTPAAPANGFTANPPEAVLPSISGRLYPDAGNNKRLSVPASCTYSTYVATGQCSAEYTYVSDLFSKDLNIRVNVERCWDYPNGLPSIALQCTGKDCASFLSTATQLKACSQDSDCGGGPKVCEDLLDPGQGDNIIYQQLQLFTTPDLKCDAGVDLARDAYVWLKQFTTGATVVPPVSSSFGLCSPDFLDYFPAAPKPRDWVHGLVSDNGQLITVAGLTNYVAPYVNNSVVVPAAGTAPVPAPFVPSPASGQDANFLSAFQLTFSQDYSTLPTDYSTQLAADLATALGISASRVSVSSVQPVTAATSMAARGPQRRLSAAAAAASTQVQVSFVILATGNSGELTSADCVRKLQAQLADHSSPLYQGKYSSAVQKDSLVVTNSGTGNAPSTASHTAAWTLAVLAALAANVAAAGYKLLL